MASKYEQIWDSLQDEEYRREFADDVATGLAFQIRMLREKNGWTQEDLAQRLGKRQEVVSLWENPNYGSYTLKTLKSLAKAFDLVPVFRLGAFGELVEWNVSLTPSRLAPPSFVEESAARPDYGGVYYGAPGTALTVLAAAWGANAVAVTLPLFTGAFAPTWASAIGVTMTMPTFESPTLLPATTSKKKEEPRLALAA